MNSDRADTIQAILSQAAHVPKSDRAAFLARACAGESASARPGIVSSVDGRGARVGTGRGDLLIVNAEIGDRVAGPDELDGLGLAPGTRLGP